jgi:hypothetical protein
MRTCVRMCVRTCIRTARCGKREILAQLAHEET